MEVYAVIYDWADCFEGDNSVELFIDKEKAIKNMKEKELEIKQEYGYDTFERPSEYEFLGYNDNSYQEKHDRVRIEKIKIN